MNSKAHLWRLLAAVVVLGASIALTLVNSPNLGLDLRGGTQITLEAQSTDRVEADAEATDRAVDVLNRRLDSLGIAETTVTRSGENRILIELPDVQDPDEAAELIGQTASLEFREVLATAAEDTEPGEGEIVLPDEQGTPLLLAPPTFDGEGVKDAATTTPQGGIGQWQVTVEFTGAGTPKWKELVSTACANPNAGQRIAIVLDGKIISAPGIVPGLCQAGGSTGTDITGDFSKAEADELSILIKGGALPVPVEFIDQRTIGPTLGEAAIDASIEASVIGLALTGLFIVFIYRLNGFMATLALAGYAVISFGILVWLGATLTLPGLAGFVLAIGLAIDANVLVFERAREEYEDSPEAGLSPAIQTGYSKAWSAIIDSNVTTLLAAVLLFFLASGAVKGFGVTLSIGVLASMFSALIVARVLSEWAMRRAFVRNRPGLSGIAGQSRIRSWLRDKGPDLMKRSGLWIVVTIAVGLVSIAGIVIRDLNLGVEFSGGRLLEYSTAEQLDPEDARVAVSDAGFPQAVVQASSSDGAGDNISVRLGNVSDEDADKVRDAIASVGGETTQVRAEAISASFGKELRNKAVIAFLIAIAAQMIYLAWRFRWTWALSAIVSMTSVVLAVVGFFAWTGKPVDGVFLAAILSIIGLAVNDTIVVFDRIRERLAGPHDDLRSMVNEAILMTIPRTINTGLGAMFILAALAVLGGDSLRDFSIAILLGLGIGILSTIFTASALAVLLEEKWPHDPEKAKAKVADPYAHIDAGSGAVL